MQIFLSIYNKSYTINDEKYFYRKADHLFQYYQRLILNPLKRDLFNSGRSSLIYISDRDQNDGVQSISNKEHNACFYTGSPSGVPGLFSKYNEKFTKTSWLSTLERLFDKFGFRLIEQLSPPFIFGFYRKGSIKILHDGLGFEQGFVYEDDNYWLCSNKVWPLVLYSNGKFEIDHDAWQHYFQCGWFPGNQTPFKQISAMGMGDVWYTDGRVVKRKNVDCLKNWTAPINLKPNELVEFFRTCFNQTVRELSENYCNKPVWSDLTGGRDTRMILSAFIHQNIDCQLNTAGEHNSTDVATVKLIQKKHFVNVSYKNSSLTAVTFQEIIDKLKKMIDWQDGFGEIKSCKYFDIEPQLIKIEPRFSGLVGGFYKADRYSNKSYKLKIKHLIREKTKSILKKNRSNFNGRDFFLAQQEKVIKEGRSYNLSGHQLQDYRNFTEAGRRWASQCASLNFNASLLPFLDYRMIRCCFNSPEKYKRSHLLHDYVIETNSPSLSKLPYADDISLTNEPGLKMPYNENEFWRTEAGNELMKGVLEKDFPFGEMIHRHSVLNMWHDHQSERANYGERFWYLAGFYFWHEKYRNWIL